MDPVLVLVAAIAVAVLLVLVVYGSRRSRRRKQELAGMANVLDAAEIVSGSLYEADLDGTKYRYQFVQGSKNSPSFLRVALAYRSPGEFMVARERRLDRWFKKLGIAVEVQTADPEFDKQFYIRTDSARFVTSLFVAAEAREAVKRLFQLGYTLVSHDGSTLEAKLSPATVAALADPGRVRDAAAELKSLGARLAAVAWAGQRRSDNGWRTCQALVYTCSVGSAVAGAGSLFWGLSAYPALDPWRLFLFGLPFAVMGLVLFVPLSVALLKGRSTSHHHLLVNLAVALGGFPALAYGGATVLNGYLDASEPVHHEVSAIRKRTAKSKSSTRNYVVVRSWRQGRNEEELKVEWGTFDRVEAGTRLQLTTKRGHYGFEWLASLYVP